MLVLLSFLISRLINRSGLRISHSKVFSSGYNYTAEYRIKIELICRLTRDIEIKNWSRYSQHKSSQLSCLLSLFKVDFVSVDPWSLCSNIVLFQWTYDPFVQIWFCFNGHMISLFKFDFVLVDLWSLCSNLILFQWTYDLFVQIWFCFSGPMIPLFRFDLVSVDLWSLCSDLILFQWTYDPFVSDPDQPRELNTMES